MAYQNMKKFIKLIRWFYPGLRIKRWVTLVLISVFFIVYSSIRYYLDISLLLRIFDGVLFVVAVTVFIIAVRYLVKSFWEVISPQGNKELIDIIYEQRLLSKGPKIVAIGGGTGLSTILEGLKEFTSNLTAIVAVADEGGSSGRLREEFGILPPGDIRNCLVSLAEVPQLMRDLFQYRFTEGSGMKGHSFGNLFITAMTQVTGSFEDAIEESSRVLAIRGRVLPSSLEKVRLKAQFVDGTSMEGEDKIPDERKVIQRIHLIPEDAKAKPEALEAIRQAEIVVLGPGSLFTSVIPNLLIKQIRDEVVKRDIPKIYICNVMTQTGETDGFTAADHIQTLITHTAERIVNCCLVNSGRLLPKLLFKYANEHSFPVIFDRERLRKMGINVFEGDVVSKHDYLRHNSDKVAKEIINIYNGFNKKNGKNRTTNFS